MNAEAAADRLLVRAHAKINLSLAVTGVRADGYHLLETVFQSLALHDLLAFERHDGPFGLACSTPGVPLDSRNLAWRAASALWRDAGRRGDPSGVRLRLTKRIPAQGGLGGGSADAAAALVALNEWWEMRLGAEKLAALAAGLGADVPFFLQGGTALGLGRGDEIQPLDDLPRHAVVLVFPAFGVSTPEAFRWYDEDRAAGLAGAEPASIPPAGNFASPAHTVVVRNDLQSPVARRHPEIDRLCCRLRELGADAAAMTGSGSTVFGLFAGVPTASSAGRALESEGWHTALTCTVGTRWARPFVRRRTARRPPRGLAEPRPLV